MHSFMTHPIISYLLFTTPWILSAVGMPAPQTNDIATSSSSQGVLDDFQVFKPVQSAGSCDVLLMQHVFANSFGQPFVGPYTPPPCSFNTVTMTLTVTSAGRQFDRLAFMSLGDIEVFRTSTAEPTQDGIIWTYTKDMTAYDVLWRSQQTVIFDLGNTVDSTFTGSYNTTLTATFSTSRKPPKTADLILPISRNQGSAGKTSGFLEPNQTAVAVQTFPPDTERAILSVAATGQSDEEFWYTNVLSSEVDTFADTAGTLNGASPFREVQVLIDNILAGVIFPFPIVFTGGLAPQLWSPIVGIDAFDLRESEIDISPFVPLLTDGNPHTVELIVSGLSDTDGNGEATLTPDIGQFWVVTGKIFVFRGARGAALTDHSPPTVSGTPSITVSSSVTTNSTGANETLAYTVNASRSLTLTSYFATVTQSLQYSSRGLIASQGLIQSNQAQSSGSSISRGPLVRSRTSFSYPLLVNSTVTQSPTDGSVSERIVVDRELAIQSTGRPDFSIFTLAAGASALDTVQLATATIVQAAGSNRTTAVGDTSQRFVETSEGSTFERTVEARNGTVVQDSAPQGVDGGGIRGRGLGFGRRPKGKRAGLTHLP